jgi:hypothetical protein
MEGDTIGTKLTQLGQEVKIGARPPGNDEAAARVKKNGARASQGTLAEAAAFAVRPGSSAHVQWPDRLKGLVEGAAQD